jgi:TolB-like protein/DNA-binding winged helix-turn-helix (wHTH) protein/tetratricopeptide (TPR) repeat protein
MREIDYPAYVFGEFTLDMARGCLTRGSDEVKLRPKSFKTLTYLVENQGRLVSKEELIGAIWPDTAVTDDSLVQCLIEIRKALGGDAQQFIKTVPRRGYIFTGELSGNGGDPTSAASVDPLPPSNGAATPVVLNESAAAKMIPPSPGRRIHRKLWIALAWAAVVALAILAVVGIRQRVLTKPAPVEIRSLAVLPLKNLSGDPAQDYFADGITEALTTELARNSSLTVISEQSTLQYRGTTKTSPEIASELKVDGLVEGSVVRMGGSIRINVRVSWGSDGRYVWSDGYEGETRDIFTLQRKVANAITDGVKLAQRQSPRAAATRTVDSEAYDTYLLGRFYWNQRTAEGYRRSIEYFQQALQKDSNLAIAYAGIAEAYALLGRSKAADMSASEAADKARGAALKALELDETLAEAHAALGRVKQTFDWDFEGAEKEFKLAIQLNPGYATTYQWYAIMAANIGRPDEAETMIQRARTLDPLSPNIRRVNGEFLAQRQQYERAIAELQQAVELGPSNFNTHITLGEVLERMGNHRKAIVEYQEALKLGGGRTAQDHLTFAQAADGGRAALEKFLQEMVVRHAEPVRIAAIYAALGRKDEAFKYLELAYQLAYQANPKMGLPADYHLEPLRSDPRFKELLHRVGFPPTPQPESQ